MEFKFRAWDIENKYMLSWEEIQGEWESEGYFRSIFNQDHYKTMQYVGLTDKDNIDIYVGDIVTDGYQTGVIEFSIEDVASCGCCWEYFIGTGFKAQGVDLTDNNIKVLGNIYENSELMGI